MSEKPQGLSTATIVFMIAVALFFDFLQFILSFIYLGWALGIVAGLTFYVWFKIHGISFMKPKRFLAFGGASLIEMIPIPFVADLPAWTAAVAYLALQSKIPIGTGEGITKLGIGQVKNWEKIDKPTFNKDNYYRIVNEKGHQDYRQSNRLRSSPTGNKPKMRGRFNIGSRETPFPSFAKGEPAYEYMDKESDNYIFESDKQMARGGEKNPVTNNKISSRHWAYRPIGDDGQVIKEMKPDMIKDIYKVDKESNTYKRKKDTW